MKCRGLGLLLPLFVFVAPMAAFSQEIGNSLSVKRLDDLLPKSVGDFEKFKLAELDAAAQEIDRAAAERTWGQSRPTPEQTLQSIATLVDAKKQVDGHLERLLALRGNIAGVPAGPSQKEAARIFLRIESRLIDLTGRLRYSLSDAIENATFDLSADLPAFNKLADMLIAQRVSVAANLLTFALFDPEKGSDLKPFPPEFKKKVLQLAAVARNVDALPELGRYLLDEHPSPELTLLAAEAIRAIGLPQPPRPGQDPTVAKPAITPAQLSRIAVNIPRNALPADLQERRDDLVNWVVVREKSGATEETFRVGESELRLGDWLLMRNPSPYNQFTDIAPGLFTHVGVVATEMGTDGIRRFVLVDLPERGNRVPATNVDAFLHRTLHYVFLRHRDLAVRGRMNEVAKSLIGNETQFDLQFRTDRVAALKGVPLRGQLIHTYCAGLLLICAQETNKSREEFFPVAEAAAGGSCLSNLAKLGMSIGDDFVSPTGAIFSPHLKIVGRREPMYEPGREVQEAVFDHFANSMVNKTLTPSPTTTQLLREKMAGISKTNPVLARLMARANGVSEKTDLQSAARAAAVVETLDEIAEGNAKEYHNARAAMLDDPAPGEQEQDPKLAQQNRTYRQRHAELYQRWREEKITAREMRVELVNYYATRGKQQLDDRFFKSP